METDISIGSTVHCNLKVGTPSEYSKPSDINRQCEVFKDSNCDSLLVSIASSKSRPMTKLPFLRQS